MVDIRPIDQQTTAPDTIDNQSSPPPPQHYDEQWYSPKLNLNPKTRQLLEDYSKIPPDQVEAHVYGIRDKAFKIYPYPCIGRFSFAELTVGQHPQYPEILERMKTGEQIFLDLGCAFAQDLRRLVADGVDSSLCYGSDLRLDFLDLGYELFNDKLTLRSKFIAADVFDPSSPLSELHGKVDIVNASSFFHLFTWDEQKAIAREIIRLLKPKKNGLIIGRQVGNSRPGEYPRRGGQGSRYRHDVESWRRMWQEVGDETGIKFENEGFMIDISHLRVFKGAEDETSMFMVFSVRRML